MKSQRALPLRRHFSHFSKEWAFVVKVHQSIIDENSCSDISKAVRTGLNLIFISFWCQMSTPAALITHFRSTHDKTLVWNGNIYIWQTTGPLWGGDHCTVFAGWISSDSVPAVPVLAAHAVNLFSSATFGTADIYIKGKRPTQRDEKPTPAAQDAKLQTTPPKIHGPDITHHGRLLHAIIDSSSLRRCHADEAWCKCM